MPRYDIRCRSCGATFEVQRSMARADEPAVCPSGHTDTVRLLPTVALTGVGGRSYGSASSASAAAGPGAGPAAAPAGGCCGGGCCGA